MKTSWMAAKAERLKQQQYAAKARRAFPMPEDKASNHDTIAAYLANGGKVRRIPCKGIMPHKSYGVTMKAKGSLAGQLWTGGKGSSNLIAAVPMKGALS